MGNLDETQAVNTNSHPWTWSLATSKKAKKHVSNICKKKQPFQCRALQTTISKKDHAFWDVFLLLY